MRYRLLLQSIDRLEGEVRLEIRIERFLGGLVIGDNFYRAIPWERDHLGNHDALTLGAELFCQRIGADEGDVDEDRLEAALARKPDEFGERSIGADHTPDPR